jgi:DNA polymerase-3 subunit alpha
VRSNPGKSSLKFRIKEPQENLEILLSSTEKGFAMNEELAEFLLDNPDVEVNVALVN